MPLLGMSLGRMQSDDPISVPLQGTRARDGLARISTLAKCGSGARGEKEMDGRRVRMTVIAVRGHRRFWALAGRGWGKCAMWFESWTHVAVCGHPASEMPWLCVEVAAGRGGQQAVSRPYRTAVCRASPAR